METARSGGELKWSSQTISRNQEKIKESGPEGKSLSIRDGPPGLHVKLWKTKHKGISSRFERTRRKMSKKAPPGQYNRTLAQAGGAKCLPTRSRRKVKGVGTLEVVVVVAVVVAATLD